MISTTSNFEPLTVLVTGAASGLGRCFVEHYLNQHNTTVIAWDLHPIDIPVPPGTPGEDGQSRRLRKQHVDFESELSITNAINFMQTKFGAFGAITNPKLDLVIHSAGIRGLVPEIEEAYPDDVAVAETLHVMDYETMMRTYQINTLGTFTLLQKLASSGLFHEPESVSSKETKVVIMSSRMGSIEHNATMRQGGAYAYRASKAALNAIVQSMSIDLPYVVFSLVHPGRVETRLTKCREEGAIEVHESVNEMLGLIKRLTRDDSGKFVDRFGNIIGW